MTLECTLFHVVPRASMSASIPRGETWHRRIHDAMETARAVKGGAFVFEYTIGATDLAELLIAALMGAALPARTRTIDITGGGAAVVPRHRLRAVDGGQG